MFFFFCNGIIILMYVICRFYVKETESSFFFEIREDFIGMGNDVYKLIEYIINNLC